MIQEVDLSYGISRGTISERILERIVETGLWIAHVSLPVQHKVEETNSRTAMPFLPFPQSISPETPKLRSTRCDLEPVVADEEEVERALAESIEVWAEAGSQISLPNKGAGKDVSKDFGRHARGYVQ